MDRHCTFPFHQSNWTAEIGGRVQAQSRRPWISHAGGRTVHGQALCLPGIVLLWDSVDWLERRLSPGFSLHSIQQFAHTSTTDQAQEFLCQLRIWTLLWLQDSILFIHINPFLFLSLIIFTLKWKGRQLMWAFGYWIAATLGNLC